MSEEKEKQFGTLALENGYITASQLAQILQEQNNLKQKGVKILVGQLLIKHGYINHVQFMEILKLQQRHIVTCPACATKHELFEKVEGKAIRCRNCGKLIPLPPGLKESTRTEGAVKALADYGIAVDEPGRKEFDHYQLIKKIGQGGMGVVFLARDKTSNRTVALKILRQFDTSAEQLGRRFIREAEILKSVDHPNIIKVLDIGEFNNINYYAMAYINGISLDQVLSEKRFTMNECVVVLEKIARAIDHAHQSGFIHRDIKPSNIMIDTKGNPYLMDFGLARNIDSDTKLTKFGTIVGTPFYMSPEQVRGEQEETDERSDVYSLGVILYEILAGVVPFTGKAEMEVYEKILNENPPTIRNEDGSANPNLEAVALKALEKEKEHRYQTAAEFAHDLRLYLAGKPVSAHPANPVEKFIRHSEKSSIPLFSIGAGIIVIILILLNPLLGILAGVVGVVALYFVLLKNR